MKLFFRVFHWTTSNLQIYR